jgi:hypothetical protein
VGRCNARNVDHQRGIAANTAADDEVGGEALGGLRRDCQQRRSARPWLPFIRIFRPQNCGAVAHALVECKDDPRLSRLYNTFYRGLDISYETVRRWVLKFGPASEGPINHQRGARC